MDQKSYGWLGGMVGAFIFVALTIIGLCLSLLVIAKVPIPLPNIVGLDPFALMGLLALLPVLPLVLLFPPSLILYPIGLIIYILVGVGLGNLYGKIKNKKIK